VPWWRVKLLHPALRLQPEQAVARPRMRMRERRRPVAQAHAVSAFLVDVQIKRHMIFPQRRREHHAVFHRHGFVLECLPDEARRRVGRHLKFVGEQLHQFRRRIGAKQHVVRTLVRELAHRDDRIAEDADVRPRALPLNRVGRIRVARIEMRHQRRSQMPACRRADDADAMGINLVIVRVCPHPAHRARHILKFSRIMVAAGAEPGFQDEAGDAMLVQPQRIVIAFVRRKMRVGAAWTNHQRRAGGIGCVRQIRRERGDVVGLRAERARRAIGPEWNGGFHLGAGQNERRK